LCDIVLSESELEWGVSGWSGDRGECDMTEWGLGESEAFGMVDGCIEGVRVYECTSTYLREIWI
jgi:hypothetical protein